LELSDAYCTRRGASTSRVSQSGHANLPIGGMRRANQEIGVPGFSPLTRGIEK
jgi:hypothetical protein